MTRSSSSIKADYLIVGAGAAGMAFADSLLSETQSTIVMADRHHRPGGHWNDAYPFVRLHQPAATYGVNSVPLGSGLKDELGLNKGLHQLASGQEVLSHFDFTMQQRFLPSGRVQYFPMSHAGDDGSITSLLSGQRIKVEARKIVDATYSQTAVPSTHPPQYSIAPGVTCIPPNDLPRTASAFAAYVVVGAGKTGMDTCLWLIEYGADPGTIRWIMPRDSWVMNRANYQPGEEFFARGMQSVANQVEALAEADSIDDLFARLEACGELSRIDPSVKPEAYHCAILSDGEMEQLRRIGDIVRLGRVTRIEADRMVLEQGAVPALPNSLYIDCSASGIPSRPARPVFEGDRITPQIVRWCQPTLSYSLIGHVEATFHDEAEKNRICTPVPAPTVPRDWLVMMALDLANRHTWSKIPELGEWQAKARLDPFTARIRALKGTETGVIEHLQRYQKNAGPAAAKLKQLLAE